MKTLKLLGVIGTALAFFGLSAQAYAAQWVMNVTPTQAIVGNVQGEILQISTSTAIVNPASCVSTDVYIVRDAAIVKSATAIALSAIASGRQVRVYVTDSCDAPTGRPLVSSIGLM